MLHVNYIHKLYVVQLYFLGKYISCLFLVACFFGNCLAFSDCFWTSPMFPVYNSMLLTSVSYNHSLVCGLAFHFFFHTVSFSNICKSATFESDFLHSMPSLFANFHSSFEDISPTLFFFSCFSHGSCIFSLILIDQ